MSVGDRFGMVLVGGSGNDSLKNVTHHWPSSAYGVNAVGALTRANNPARYSNGGPYVDFITPGDEIISTVPGGGYLAAAEGGTSSATPHVSALAALAFSAYKEDKCNPLYIGKGGKRNKVVEDALIRSVNKLGKFTTNRTDMYGRGMPEGDKVVKLLMGIQV
ncbi:MAG: S8 family serine peptidase [Nitrososphaeraceae archaeon]